MMYLQCGGMQVNKKRFEGSKSSYMKFHIISCKMQCGKELKFASLWTSFFNIVSFALRILLKQQHYQKVCVFLFLFSRLNRHHTLNVESNSEITNTVLNCSYVHYCPSILFDLSHFFSLQIFSRGVYHVAFKGKYFYMTVYGSSVL